MTARPVAATVEDLDAAREAVAAATAEIAAIEAAPQPLNVALEAFDNWLDNTATAALDSFSSLHHLLQPNARNGLRLGNVSPETIIGLFALLAGDRLRDLVAGQLGDLVGERETLTAEARALRLEEARGRLLRCELVEELLARALEAAGRTTPRRPDADPRAILASDNALTSVR